MTSDPEDLARTGHAAKAVELLHKHLAKGDGSAASTLAHWHMTGEFVTRDLGKSRDFFAQAASLGDSDAEAPLTALLANGAGGLDRHWDEALARFAKLGAKDAAVARQAALIAAMDVDSEGDPRSSFTPEFASNDPLIVQFRGFMSPQECAELTVAARDRLSPATVVDPNSGALIRDPVRDSSAAAFPFLYENPFIHALNRRIAAASRSTPEQGEPMQVLAYEPGQQYRLHSDAIPGVANQRIQTFLVFLTEDFDGGATYFPEPDLSLRPAVGDAICFSNVSADMRPAASARHCGMPVTRGTKMILSKWIRQFPLDLSRPHPSHPS